MDFLFELGFSPTVQFVKKKLVGILGAILDSDEGPRKLERAKLKVQVLVDSVKTMPQDTESYKMQQLWLHDTQCALLDAEDLLDEIALTILESASRSYGKRKFLLTRLKVSAPSVLDMRERLENTETFINEWLKINQLHSISKFHSISKLQSSSLVDESSIIGREDDMRSIISLLANDRMNETFSVISIVGMVGVGKTTLAQLVYNSDDVVKNFYLRIWISISAEHDAKSITRSMLEFVCEKNSEFSELSDLDPLQIKLQNVLRGKKVLVVLDGVCNEDANDWETLCLPFNVVAKGSKILVTTQSILVSEMVSTFPMYYVQILSDQCCWRLIDKRALASLSPEDSKRLVLEVVGFKISQKCKGLPWLAKMFGEVLRLNHDERKWDAILKSKLWELPVSRSIFPTLKLSYDQLSSCLQRCLAFCSIFPPDYEFERDQLVRLWISEGFIEESEVGRAQEIGREYFDVLVQRSFFQLSPGDHENRQVFKMHSLIHDFADFVSDGLCIRVEDGMSLPIPNLKDVRHLSLISGAVQAEHLGIFGECDRMRTLILSSKDGGDTSVIIPSGFFDKIKTRYLRVLNLSFSNIDKIPNSIDTAKHMRHLDVSSTPINSLPESITNLNGMETLKLNNCANLVQWPKKMKSLTNLQHLEVDLDTLRRIKIMPSEFGKLTNLQNLSAFIVAKEEGRRIAELKDMNYLHGSLCITNLENISDGTEAANANLQQKRFLDTLELRWTDVKDGREDVLGKLEPHTRIKHLTIRGYGGLLFPGWVGNPKFCRIESIVLKKCICEVFPFLGHLPMLKDLRIEKISQLKYVEEEEYERGSPGFRSLQSLTLRNMQDLIEWRVLKEGDMPKLSQLTIDGCPALETLPTIGYLASLENVEILKCPKLKCLPSGQPPSSMKRLVIKECDDLKARCMDHESEDWKKMQSIPEVEIDDLHLHL